MTKWNGPFGKSEQALRSDRIIARGYRHERLTRDAERLRATGTTSPPRAAQYGELRLYQIAQSREGVRARARVQCLILYADRDAAKGVALGLR